VIDSPSPNHGPRPVGIPVDILVLHYTGMQTAEAALDRLRDPAAGVSAHYLVEEDGRIHALVPESRRAWHAGVSVWRGVRDVNSRSVGIEIVNPGHEWGYRPFPAEQMVAVTALCRAVLDRHPIPRANVVGHSDIAPARKTDPGELFDWRGLANAGVGLWHGLSGAGRLPVDLGAALRLLRVIGYGVPPTAGMNTETRAVLRAFQRRFRPDRIDGGVDSATMARIAAMASLTVAAGGIV